VITAASENARDKLMPLIKTKLREYDDQARASAYITKYEMHHKSLIYDALKHSNKVKIIDWGNRVLAVNAHNDVEGRSTFRKVFQLSQPTENINSEISNFKSYLEDNWQVAGPKKRGKSSSPKNTDGKPAGGAAKKPILKSAFKTPKPIERDIKGK
jgi:hypothetical protein